MLEVLLLLLVTFPLCFLKLLLLALLLCNELLMPAQMIIHKIFELASLLLLQRTLASLLLFVQTGDLVRQALPDKINLLTIAHAHLMNLVLCLSIEYP